MILYASIILDFHDIDQRFLKKKKKKKKKIRPTYPNFLGHVTGNTHIPVCPVVVHLRNFSCCWPQSATFDRSKSMIYFSLYSSLILVWKKFVKGNQKTETLTQVFGLLTVAIFVLVLDLCTRM